MERVKFRKGEQRKFLDLIINKLNCVSLRGILQFGFEIKYASLKNYYTERRLMPRNLFESLCRIAKINTSDFKINYLDENWGQVKGGRIGRK